MNDTRDCSIEAESRPVRPVCAAALHAALLFGAGVAQAGETLPFVSSFEAGENPPYVAGDLNGQGTAGSWTVGEGSAEVQGTLVSRGLQAVALQPRSSAEVAVSTANTVVWTDLYLQTEGSPGSPSIPAETAAAVLFFGEASGIWALDGDGNGGGSFVSVVDPLPTGRFVRVSVRQYFPTSTYNVWIDGQETVSGLGFKDNAVTAVSAVQFDAEGSSYLDDVSVTAWGPDQDTDDDHLVDLDELKFHGTSPINPDSDGDGMKDGEEVFVGFLPNDSQSVFTAGMAPAGGQMEVRFQTVTGRLYAVQQLADLAGAGWTNAPGLDSIAGDGAEKHLAVDNSAPARDFRISVR